MRIHLNHSLNKHYTDGTWVTIRVDSSLSSGPLRPGCWQPALQHKLVRLRETRPRPFNNWTPHHSKSADLVRVG